jgi:hypothetical protein
MEQLLASLPTEKKTLWPSKKEVIIQKLLGNCPSACQVLDPNILTSRVFGEKIVLSGQKER